MADNELLPCPFCGGEARPARERHVWSIICTSDDTACVVCPETQWFDSEAEATAAWNRRAPTKAEGLAAPAVDPELQVLLDKAREWSTHATPEEREAMMKAQRERASHPQPNPEPEVTPEMIEAGARVLNDWIQTYHGTFAGALAVYRAMKAKEPL